MPINYRSHLKKKAFSRWFVVLTISMGLLSGVFQYASTQARADEVEELQKQIDELSKLRQMSESATQNLEVELKNIRSKIASSLAQLNAADTQTKTLEANINTREDDLSDHYDLLKARVRSYYKLTRQFSPLATLLSIPTASGITRQISYHSAVASQDKEAIVDTTQDILSLESDKKALDLRKAQLKSLRVDFEKNAKFFEGEIKGAKNYQEQLGKQIAELSAKQKEILAAKSGTFQTSVGDVPQSDDAASRPDYNPGFSPAFAAFSFGAPHYKGMSQYGAFGRAQSGQSYQDILKAYYGNVRIDTKDMPGSINTSAGSMSFEDQYLKGIAEMPTGWGDKGGMEALKAQAIAARTYALSYVGWRVSNPNASGSICTSEQCQVYSASKASGGAAKWYEAVSATKGQVVVSNSSNEIFATWYSSTSGGYLEAYTSLGHTTPSFWDTPDGRSGWTSKAWEKVGGSPWFYKGWYRERSGDACGRSHPWLTSEEMADILNAWVVLIKTGQNDDRVTPQGSCWGGNPYSLADLRAKADSVGGGYAKVNGVSVTYGDNGVTASVSFETDKGSVTINGTDFKKAFNLRSPGRVAIKSGLYNMEKK